MTDYFIIGKQDIADIYSRLQTAHQRKEAELRERLYGEIPELAELERELTATYTGSLRSLISLPPEEAAALKAKQKVKIQELRERKEGEPSAVLIRGGEPVLGTPAMARLRYGTAPEALTAYQRKHFGDGPGKLCKALALTRAEDGTDLTGGTLWVTDDPADLGLALPQETRPIAAAKRIGIDYAEEAKDFLWRFTYEEHAK